MDDRTLLPEKDRFIFTGSEGNKKPITTVGNRFSSLQYENFNIAAQPYYVILSPQEQLLNNPVAYMTDPDEYAAWLQCGIDAHKKLARK